MTLYPNDWLTAYFLRTCLSVFPDKKAKEKIKTKKKKDKKEKNENEEDSDKKKSDDKKGKKKDKKAKVNPESSILGIPSTSTRAKWRVLSLRNVQREEGLK